VSEDDGGFDGAGLEGSRQKPWLDLAEAEQVLAGPVVGVGRVGGFAVDPERAQACVDELSRIAEDVLFGLRDSRMFGFDPPGYDEVSLNLARNARVMAARAEAFTRAWVSRIEETRDALQRQLSDYRSADQANAGRQA
jgi:hypothetical protein